MLAPLANNGGATWTHALLPGSPAIDAANNATCMSTDQRGIDRPKGPACDMGAYEWLGFTLSIAAAGNGSGVVTPTVGAHSYWPGAVVALQANANIGSIFAGWSGNADCLDGSVTMIADKSCTATFTVNGYTLTPLARE